MKKNYDVKKVFGRFIKKATGHADSQEKNSLNAPWDIMNVPDEVRSNESPLDKFMENIKLNKNELENDPVKRAVKKKDLKKILKGSPEVTKEFLENQYNNYPVNVELDGAFWMQVAKQSQEHAKLIIYDKKMNQKLTVQQVEEIYEAVLDEPKSKSKSSFFR